ncbi:MAG: anaerobic ribonucleoside-triphosphate reductase [bacterium]
MPDRMGRDNRDEEVGTVGADETGVERSGSDRDSDRLGKQGVNPYEHWRVKTLIFSRIVGYLQPVDGWNPGKAREFAERVVYKPDLRGDPDGTTSAEREMAIHGGGLE